MATFPNLFSADPEPSPAVPAAEPVPAGAASADSAAQSASQSIDPAPASRSANPSVSPTVNPPVAPPVHSPAGSPAGNMDVPAPARPVHAAHRPMPRAPVPAPTFTPVKDDTTVTRETKLALILGLAVCMVVLVLFGEHFSKARQPVPATDPALLAGNQPVPPGEAATGDSAGIAGLLASGENAAPAPSPAVPAPVDPPIDPTASAQAGAQNPGGRPGPVEFVNGQPLPPPAARTTQTGDAPTGPGAGSIDSLVARPDRPAPETVSVPEVTPGLGGGAAAGAGSGGLPSGPEAVVPVTPKPQPAVAEVMYPVRAGDTITKILREQYGEASPSAIEKFKEYNRSRLTKSGGIQAGVTLRLPPRAVLGMSAEGRQPRPAGPSQRDSAAAKAPGKDASGAARPGSKEAEKAPRTTPAPSAARTYTVRKGDTLGEIAQRELGSATLAREIMKLNGLKDENIKVGSVLRLPARKASEVR